MAACLAVLIACHGGNADSRYKVSGLTDDIYLRICGTWDRYADIQTTEGLFSWGSAKHVPNGSLDIDLGAEQPTIAAPWGLFYVRAVRQSAKDQYVLSVTWKRTAVPDDHFDVVLQFSGDGSMRWLPAGIMGKGNDGPYYKLDGPKKPK